jgi:hypothetical protein
MLTAARRFVNARRWQSFANLVKPSLATIARVDVENVEVVDRAGRHANTRARTALKQFRDCRRVRARILETARGGRALVPAAGENCERPPFKLRLVPVHKSASLKLAVLDSRLDGQPSSYFL